jgi:hypothetical protein
VWRVSSVAVVGLVEVMVGASLTAEMETSWDWEAQRLGLPPSQTRRARVQAAAGVGPAGVKVRTPEAPSMEPPQVWVPRRDQVAPGPSLSVTSAS